MRACVWWSVGPVGRQDSIQIIFMTRSQCHEQKRGKEREGEERTRSSCQRRFPEKSLVVERARGSTTERKGESGGRERGDRESGEQSISALTDFVGRPTVRASERLSLAPLFCSPSLFVPTGWRTEEGEVPFWERKDGLLRQQTTY